MKSKWVIAGLSVVIVSLLIFLGLHFKRTNKPAAEVIEKLAAVTETADVPLQSFGAAAVSAKPVSGATQTPGSALVSLSQMTNVLGQFTKPDSRLKDLISYLNSTHQDPILVKDKNEFTGELNIVRTKSPLSGTRYFHAQYFSGENGQEFAQHMSFQFRPGPEAMKEALAAVHKTFPSLSKPTDNREDFMQWSLPNGYVVWVKRMGLADLQDSRFNAYSKDDVGTIWVAVELSPEEGE